MCLSVEVEMGSSCDKGIIYIYLSSMCVYVHKYAYVYHSIKIKCNLDVVHNS